MDPNYNPEAPASRIKIGENILENPKNDSEIPAHQKLADTVKQQANPYAVSQAFQKGLPGINR
jgi:hypothetical protein